MGSGAAVGQHQIISWIDPAETVAVAAAKRHPTSPPSVTNCSRDPDWYACCGLTHPTLRVSAGVIDGAGTPVTAALLRPRGCGALTPARSDAGQESGTCAGTCRGLESGERIAQVNQRVVNALRHSVIGGPKQFGERRERQRQPACCLQPRTLMPSRPSIVPTPVVTWGVATSRPPRPSVPPVPAAVAPPASHTGFTASAPVK